MKRLAADVVAAVVTTSLTAVVACGKPTKPAASAHAASASVSASASTRPPDLSPDACAPTEAPATRLADPIARVELKGLTRLSATTLCASIGSKANLAYDADRISRDIQTLWSSGLIDDVSVTSEPSEEGRILVYTLHERPVVRSWKVEGVGPGDPAKVRKLLGDEGKLFFADELRTKIGLLREQYRILGYRAIEISFTIEPSTDNKVDVTVSVKEGPLTKIKDIRVNGVSKGKESEIRALIDTDEGRVNQPGKRFSDDRFERTLLLINAYYYDRGMIEVETTQSLQIDPNDPTAMTVTIDVKEGAVFKLSKLSCAGDLSMSPAKCVEQLGVKPGEVFNRTKLWQGLERIRAMQQQAARGTQIEPKSELDPKKHTVALVIEVGKE